MIKSYIKIAWRNLMNKKVFSFINIIGLSAGMACFILITAFVLDELSYDRYAPNANQIYRVGLHLAGDHPTDFPMVDNAVGPGIKNALPGIEDATRLANWNNVFIKYGDKQFKEPFISVVDANFLDVFAIPFLEGDIKTALKEPNTVVISEAIAKKYFGNEPAMGKLLTFGADKTRKVTGVISKVPDNTHFHSDVFISRTEFANERQSWSNVVCFTYLILKKGVDAKALEAKFPQLVAKYVVPEIQNDMGVSLAEAQKSINTFLFNLQPVTDIHLRSNTKYELEPNGDIRYVYIFACLGAFILLLAGVNFTNLSTASASKRSREVGIRKVMGSLKAQLVSQFLMESVLLTFIALLFAAGLIFILLPYFNELAGKHITFGEMFNYKTLVSLVFFGLVVGVMAGIYPAFFLSSFKTISVLKGNAVKTTGKGNLRSGLVIFQFAVSGALIIATIIVYQQLHFMQNKKPGFDKDQIVAIQDTRMLGKSENTFRDQLLQDSRVVSATLASNVPVAAKATDGTQIYAKDNVNKAEVHTNIFHVDENYLSTLNIPLKEGRNFSKAFISDSSAVLINEATAQELGWDRGNAIGKTIVRSGQKEFKVIGVMKDFHYTSAREKIAPLIMMLGWNSGYIMVKVKGGDAKQLLASLKQQWDAFDPPAPFSYSFLDESFSTQYAAEQRTGHLFTVFAVISILIACLGLFGLAAFTAEQRTKEIGIRKVLGASVQQVLVMVSKEFLFLVMLAFIVSVPVAWWAMHNWLADFAYRIEIKWWVFVIAGGAAMFIAFITVSFQSVKAALANPVKSLRSE
jgi:putative ABC transport system permease protein